MKRIYCSHLSERKKLGLIYDYFYANIPIDDIFKDNKNIFSTFKEFKSFMAELVRSNELVKKAKSFDKRTFNEVPAEIGSKNEPYFENEFEYGARTHHKFEDLCEEEQSIYFSNIDSTFETVQTFESKINF